MWRPGSGSTRQSVELRHLGGALGRPAADAGALGRLQGDFALFAAGVAPEPDDVRRTSALVDRIKEAMRPWDAGRRYLNFAERPGSAPAAFTAAGYERLRSVKSAYDPTNIVIGNHPIEPLTRER